MLLTSVINFFCCSIRLLVALRDFSIRDESIWCSVVSWRNCSANLLCCNLCLWCDIEFASVCRIWNNKVKMRMHKNSVMRVVVVVVILEAGEEDFIVSLWIYIELMSVDFGGVWNRILICDVAFGCTSCCVLAPSCWCCFRFMLFRSSCTAFCLLSTIFICNVALTFFFFCLIWMLTWIYGYDS